MAAEWVGGVLLIDELDATLHPAAQIALMKVLSQEARKTGIQIMFTTHSLTLLESVCSKTIHNCNDEDCTNGIELYYLTNANRKLKIKRNISYIEIENDLKLTAMLKDKRKIKLYSEDDEARWFIKHILGDMADEFDFVEASIGCNELMRLYKSDIEYFRNALIIFDGDVKEEQLNDKIGKSLREAFGNIISLMGEKRPEEVIYDYIMNLDSDHEFWVAGDGFGLSWDYFKTRGPDSYEKVKPREKYKIWFKDNLPLFEVTKLMDFWIRDNESVVEEFKRNISKIRDSLKRRMLVS